MPLAPHDNVVKLTNHIGPFVRDNIPISFQYWKGSDVATKVQNGDEEAQKNAQQYVVPDTEKNMIWTEVQLHFSFSKRYKYDKCADLGHVEGCNSLSVIQETTKQRLHQEGNCTRFLKERTCKVARSPGFICAVQAIARSRQDD
jgi:hypothetical protein